MSFRRLTASFVAALTMFSLLSVVPAAPAGASSLPISTTISPAWGRGTLSIVRTGWTVTVTGTLTDTRSDGDCVYVEAVLEVDDWTDPDTRTPDLCTGNGTSRSVNLSMTPGKGSKLNRIRVRVCAADWGLDSCEEKIFTVPSERAVQPTRKAAIDTYMNASMTSFQTSKAAKPWPYNWTDDGCSSPLGNSPGGFAFLKPCQRHDFGYRNYGKGAIKASPFDSTRKFVDDRFLSDMQTVCAGYPSSSRPSCLNYASIYYTAVRTAGGRAFYTN